MPLKIVDPDIIVGLQSISGALNYLKKTPYIICSDNFNVVAMVMYPIGKTSVMMKLLPLCNGTMNGVVNNVFNAIKCDHRCLFWIPHTDDKDQLWAL